jgi:hypothetical protein
MTAASLLLLRPGALDDRAVRAALLGCAGGEYVSGCRLDLR